jgi:hypothetical protein
MREWDIRGTDEQGIWISFDNRYEAEEWISDHTKRFPEHTQREGLHIVECERESIGEKCMRLETEIQHLQAQVEKAAEALRGLLNVYCNDIKCPYIYCRKSCEYYSEKKCAEDALSFLKAGDSK